MSMDPTADPSGGSNQPPTSPWAADPTGAPATPPPSPWTSGPTEAAPDAGNAGAGGFTPPPAPPGPPASPYGAPAPSPYGAAPQQPPYGAPPAYGTPPAYGSTPGYGAPPMPAYGGGYGGMEHPQATVILILGIVSIVVCQLTGPFAWIMGRKALREIDASGQAYSNRGQVQAGMICGIVGSVLLVLVILYLIVVVGIIGMAATSGSLK